MRCYESWHRRSIGAFEMILWASCFVFIAFAINEYFDIVYADNVMDVFGIH